ncbi:MAG: nSTAND1 domain-containing NTPase [Pseudonocardiales bacterium]
MARVFISYASGDRTLAGELRQWLVDDGHEVFWDQDLRTGEQWQQQIHDWLRWADVVVCVVTSAYLASTWCAGEVAVAQSRGCRLLPLRAERGAVHPMLESLQHADYTRGPEVAQAALTAALRLLAGGWPDDRSPFPGLRPFEINRHRVFFGRTAEVGQLAGLLRSPAARVEGAARLVVGPSGCGKSSLVRAGLLPVLAGEPGWSTLAPIVPGTDPVAALVQELATEARQSGLDWPVPEVRHRLDEGDLAGLVGELLRAASGDPRRWLLVVVDQFEELLTQTAPEERARFAELLRPALAGPVQLVGTLRPEFLAQLLGDPHLAPLPTQVYPLRPLHREALREVIEGPARLAGIGVAASLVDQLVDDTGSGEALPLLAFTLAQLAKGISRGGQLSAQRYAELGGVRGALAGQADTALADAVKAGGRSREDVIAGLLRLVTVDAQGRPTRWRVSRDELSDQVCTELEPFVARRLLITDTDHDTAVIGVAHEAFLSEWPPLAEAITTRVSGLRARRAVEHAAAEWHEHGRSPTRLWGGGQLAAAATDIGARIRPAGTPSPGRRGWSRQLARRRVLVTDQIGLDAKAHDFVYASLRHDRSRRRRAATVLSGLLVVALGAAGVAVYQQRDAQHLQWIAISRQLITQADAIRETDPRTALLLGIAAEGIRPGGETRASLVNTLTTTRYAGARTDHPGTVTSMAFSPSGNDLATAGLDGTVILREVTDPARTRQSLVGHTSAVSAMAFTPDGRTLATAGDDRTVILWEHTGLTWTPRLPLRQDSAVSSVAFAPDGRTLATATFDSGTVLLWDLTDPARPALRGSPLIGQADTVFSVTFSPDGSMAGTGDSDGHAVLWNLADPAAPPQSLNGHTSAVNSLAFSPDGQMVATASDDNTALIWDLTDRTQPRLVRSVLSSHTGRVTAVAFAPDGETLITASDDNTALLWNLTDRTQPRLLGSALSSHTGRVTAVAFAADGRTLVTASADGTVIQWSLIDRAQPQRLGPPVTGQPSPVDSVMFTPDGRALDITSSDGTVIRRDLTRPDRPSIGPPLHRPSTMVDYLAATPDGSTEVTASGDGVVTLWDRTGRAEPRRPGEPLTGHRSLVTAAAFSSDGRTLATASGDGDLMLWDITDRAEPRRLGQRLTGHRRLVTSTVFSTDGRTLATASDDGTVVLWDLTDRAQPRPLGQPLTGHAGSVAAVAFAPDGNTLATGGFDATVVLWDLTALHQLRTNATEHACAITEHGLSPDEWDRYIPDLPYQDTCDPITAGGDGLR